jgi:predicted Zn-ribbon and HTH transcriptional regulator
MTKATDTETIYKCGHKFVSMKRIASDPCGLNSAQVRVNSPDRCPGCTNSKQYASIVSPEEDD